jgi:hypothetical protein
MSTPRPPAVLAAVLAVVLLGGCGSSMPAVATVVSGGTVPNTAQDLEKLVITDVPSRLPRLPDDGLQPPAGRKDLEDVARYAKDPGHEQQVLREYGYRFGWERFWGRGTGPTTSVFVYQFRDWASAGVYAREIAGNDAEYYHGMLQNDPPQLPAGCWLLSVDKPSSSAGLHGPAAFAWCGHGVFSVSVTAVSTSPQAAQAEVATALKAQLRRLPPR